jgi:hypothetical protein
MAAPMAGFIRYRGTALIVALADLEAECRC